MRGGLWLSHIARVGPIETTELPWKGLVRLELWEWVAFCDANRKVRQIYRAAPVKRLIG